ncbi:hypothetical protein AFLA_010951 [Aspergillus flavus NRRL3357]|nr:hypothetical protein AFLA_010951 [Aspergillus flavus NRRL3357]
MLLTFPPPLPSLSSPFIKAVLFLSSLESKHSQGLESVHLVDILPPRRIASALTYHIVAASQFLRSVFSQCAISHHKQPNN